MKRSSTGFSLVEVLVALFILGMGIATLFNLFPLGWQALAHSRKLNEVYLLADRKMEECKTRGHLEEGQASGQEGDLNWSISLKPFGLQGGGEVTFVQMEIDFVFQNQTQKQRFITYLTKK
jgi:prepilin-type N-terminal cleavage/methylation domain-containing protein